jgi:hypothetical protein
MKRKVLVLVILAFLVVLLPFVFSQVSLPGCCSTTVCTDSDQETCTNIGGTFYSGKFCTQVQTCGCCVCSPNATASLFVDNIYSSSGCQAACQSKGASTFAIFPGKTIQDCQQIGIRTVSGTVTDQNSNLISQAVVTASPSGRTANTNSQGQYTLTLVNTGDTLTASYQGATSSKTITASQNVYDFVLTISAAKASISGTVKDNKNQNVQAASVTLGVKQATTDTNGAFSITSIDPGKYKLAVSKTGYAPYQENLTFSAGEAKTKTITLTAGQVTLTGKVTDANNVGIQFVSVSVQGIAGLFDMTDSIGAYDIANVPYGTVTISATPSSGNYISQSKTIEVSAANKVLNFVLASVGPCSDGTPRMACSQTKPKLCTADGQLLSNYCFGADQTRGTIDDCGCPSGYDCQIDGSCKLLQKQDCCKYEFQCYNILQAGACAPGTITCSQECYPIENCPENVPLNDRSVVDPVCYCGRDVMVADNTNQFCCDLSGSPFVSPSECPSSNFARITGEVRDTGTNQKIQAFVTVDNNNTYLSITEDGIGLFSVPASPNKQVTLEFSKPNYFTKTIKVDSPASQQIKDIGIVKLDLKSMPCYYPETIAVPNFKAEAVKCKPYVALSWSKGFCDNIDGFIVVRENDGKTWLFENNVGNFTDTGESDLGLEWGEKYNYSISVHYSDFQSRQSELKVASVKLGSPECENKCDVSEFCADNYKRVFCDDKNILTFAPTNKGYPSNCADLKYTGNEWFCAGPDSSGSTWCYENGLCGYNSNVPFFGLFFTPENCYYDDQGSMQACFIDRSRTSVDFCFQCPPKNSSKSECSLYQSKASCQQNKCGIANCAWNEGFFTQTGEGICYDTTQLSDIKYNLKQKNLDSNCQLCSKTAGLFRNFGCDQTRCSRLGFCYSMPDNGAVCDACTNTTACSDFKTREACIGATGRTQQFELSTPSAPVSAKFSDDACGFGRCFWDGAGCFKDGDGDRVKDCSSRICEQDNLAPKTVPLFKSGTLNAAGSPIEFNVSEDIRAFYFCLYKQGSSPCTQFKSILPLPGQHIISLNPIGQFPEIAGTEGGYALRYFSEDTTRNRELLKETALFIDPVVPTLSVEFFTECINCQIPGYPKQSKVKFVIQASEVVKCTDEFIVLGKNYSSKLSGKTNYEVTYPSSGGIDDGIYEYRLNCEDSVGNKMSVAKTVKVDSYVMIKNVKPQGAIKDTDVVFEAYSSEKSTCTISVDGASALPMESVDKQYQSFEKSFIKNTHHIFNIICKEIGSDKVDSFIGEFSIDILPPQTWIYINGEKFTPPRSFWRVYKDNASVVRLQCVDQQIQGSNLNYGCDKTLYCITQGSGCSPNIPLSQNNTLNINQQTTVCYYSSDKGGNSEAKYCGAISVDGTKPMTSLFNITLVNPQFGVSNSSSTDFTVRTNRQGLCRYSKNIPTFEFVEGTPFDKSDFTIHIQPALGIDSQYPEYQPVYVWCQPANDTLPDASTVFYLAFDTTAPNILSVSAEPAIVKEYPLKTRINVTTDDETLCKYGKGITSYNSAPESFPDNNIFSTTHQIDIANLSDGQSYTYDIICKNLAGKTSAKKSATFSVDLSLPAGITIITPKDGAAYNTTALSLDVKTDKRAKCWYSESKDFPQSATNLFPHFDNVTLRHFYTDAFNFTAGKHAIYVKCIFGTGAPMTAKSNFTIDITGPSKPVINSNSFVCSASSLNISWTSNDTESGIKQYAYQLLLQNNPINSSKFRMTSSKSIQSTGDTLSSGATYVIAVKAMNNANIWSEVTTSIGFTIQPNTEDCLSAAANLSNNIINDTTKPTARIDTQELDQGLLAYIICQDNVECDITKTKYGLGVSEADCVAEQMYTDPISISSTKFLCWSVTDKALNTGLGGQLITVGPKVCTGDMDCDGLPDSWQLKYFGESDCRDQNVCGPDADPDGDGLTNRQEYSQQTDPKKADTDGDGYSDYQEYLDGFDPLDINSHPTNLTWLWIILTIIVVLGAGIAGYYFYVYYTTKTEREARLKAQAKQTQANVQQRAQQAQPSKPAAIQRQLTPEEKAEREAIALRDLRRKGRDSERSKLFDKFGKPLEELKKISIGQKMKEPETAEKNEKDDIFAKLELLAKNKGDIDKLNSLVGKVKTKTELDRLVELSKNVKMPGSAVDRLMRVVEREKVKKARKK